MIYDPRAFEETENDRAGQAAKRAAHAASEARIRKRQPRITQRAGIPDALLFGKGETMAGHLARFRTTWVRAPRVLDEISRRGEYGVDPAVPVWAWTRTWRSL